MKTQHRNILIFLAAYVAAGLILYAIHKQSNVRFVNAFPSQWKYGLTWPYWEVKSLFQ